MASAVLNVPGHVVARSATEQFQSALRSERSFRCQTAKLK